MSQTDTEQNPDNKSAMDKADGFSSQVVLVTGASRGIGRAIAIAFAEKGAKVVINHPGDEEAAAETAELVNKAGGTALMVKADVSIPEEIEQMVSQVYDHWGQVDVLVNNAGICPFLDFFDIDVETWDRVHQVNLRSAFILSQLISKRMIKAGRGGRIVSVSSISAWVGGASQVHYCPTKAGLSSLTKSLAIVLGPHGINCNAVLPGTIATDINREDLAQDGKQQMFEERIPLGRVGKPDDIAGVAVFLASPEASYINGAEILVDGGHFVNLQ